MKAKLLFSRMFGNTGIGGLKKAGLLFFASLSLGLFMNEAPLAESKEAEILLLHTNSVTGHLFPCPT